MWWDLGIEIITGIKNQEIGWTGDKQRGRITIDFLVGNSEW